MVTYIDNSVFAKCTELVTLILRSETLVPLASVTVFTQTPMASGTGYIYVPSDLVDSYKSATNWSAYADQIRAIEDYPEITGEDEDIIEGTVIPSEEGGSSFVW